MKIKKTYLILSIPVILALISVVVIISNTSAEDETIISGIIETTDVDVASKIPGRIDSVFVSEGDRVVKGQVLAILESKEMTAKLEQTRGLMEAAKFKYQMAQNGARKEEKEAIEKLYFQAKHQFELAEKTWTRIQNIYKENLISTQERDQYEFQYKAAHEQMMAAKSKYEMVMKGARYEEIEMAKNAYYQAENGFNEAKAYFDELTIKSPVTGEIYKKVADQGEIVATGYPVFTLIVPNDSWVTLQVKENQLGALSIGSKLFGTIPALNNQKFEFEVYYISPIGDFANWKPTNLKGDFDVKTFEVRLRAKEKIKELRPGMTANIIFSNKNNN